MDGIERKGAKGLKHRSAGRASNRAAPRRLRKRVLALIREKYSGGGGRAIWADAGGRAFGAVKTGVTVDHETLRRWMVAAGLWSRARKRSPHRRRRERMAHFGELVQLDGSFHPWFEDRGAHELFADAGGRCDRRRLSAGSARRKRSGPPSRSCGRWIEQYGIPRALYTDWKNVYVRPAEFKKSVRPAPSR